MRGSVLKFVAGLLALLWPAGSGVASGQSVSLIRGPVTALYLEGNRLLIGQGPTLVEATVTADGARPVLALDMRRHDVRAIASRLGITFVLSEDGLTTLDPQHRVLDFAEGGGQRLLIQNGRAYVAALGAGVRVLKFDVSGKLTRLAVLPTLGPASDLAPQGDHSLWVAEGTAGVRLYEVSSSGGARVLTWLGGVTPASLVRSSTSRLYIGHANRLTVVDTTDTQTPRVLGTTTLAGDNSGIGNLLIQGNRVFVGRMDANGADVLAVNVSNPTAMTPSIAFGTDGAGEHLALSGDDVLIGSGRLGLRRVRFRDNMPVQVAAWEPLGQVTPCSLSAPTDPQPPNLSAVPAGPVTLQWKTDCRPAAVPVQINGTPVVPLDGPSYRFSPRSALTTWQVTALDAAGRRTDGPRWTFESLADAWLATPAPAPNPVVLYTPPPILIDWHSPGFVGILACAALGTGLSVVVGVAWLLGSVAQRRTLRRRP